MHVELWINGVLCNSIYYQNYDTPHFRDYVQALRKLKIWTDMYCRKDSKVSFTFWIDQRLAAETQYEEEE